MKLTTQGEIICYHLLLGATDNGPLTDEKRDLLMSIDLEPFDITKEDKVNAIRQYESIVGLILTQNTVL